MAFPVWQADTAPVIANPGSLTTWGFGVLVVLVLAVVAVGLHRTGYRPMTSLALGVLYLVLPAVLAGTGTLNRYSPLPAPALVLILLLSGLTAFLILSETGTRLVTAAPLAGIVTLQAFRVVVEVLLYRLYREGVVPVQMTFAGRNWDVISGLSGLALGLWLLHSGTRFRGMVLGWNILSLALLANIVGTAVLSTPTPFRAFPQGPPNLLPSMFPFVWLPSFLVQVAWASHLLVFRKLHRREL